MENENLIPEEEVSILTLTDENGADVEFEYNEKTLEHMRYTINREFDIL